MSVDKIMTQYFYHYFVTICANDSWSLRFQNGRMFESINAECLSVTLLSAAYSFITLLHGPINIIKSIQKTHSNLYELRRHILFTMAKDIF